MELEGKVIVVTGGASGLGEAQARSFARKGARVVIADRQPADHVAAAIEGDGGSALAAVVDVRSTADWQSLLDAAIDRFGRVDGLVNNAAVSRRANILETSDEDWGDVLGVNVDGSFVGVRETARRIAPHSGGSIVLVSSLAGLVGHPSAAYATSKWAVRGLAKSAVGVLAAKGIRINSLHPGIIDTPMAHHGTASYVAANVAMTPLGRMGTADEVAETAAFLIGDRSSFVTGAELSVDGGAAAFGAQMALQRTLNEAAERTAIGD